MNIGNPIKAIPRYAKIIVDTGFKGNKTPIPHLNTIGSGIADNAIYNTALYANQHPYQAVGASLGGMVVNNMIGNPIGAAIDTVTFGLTDFKKDEVNPIHDSQIIIYQPTMQQPTMQQGQQIYNLPPLNEAEKKRQLEYLQRKAATDLITIQALQQQPGMEQY